MATFWRKLWKVKVQEKVKIFIWRLYHNFLPLGHNLCKRGIKTDEKCIFCHFPVENPEHLFLNCWWSKAFWFFTQLDHNIFQGQINDLSAWLWKCTLFLQIDDLTLLVYGLYTIWFCRNKLFHGDKCQHAQMAALNTRFTVRNFLNPCFKIKSITDEPSFSWEGN